MTECEDSRCLTSTGLKSWPLSRASGLTDVQVFGIEGPAWSLVKAAEQQPGEGPTDELIASAMEAARMAEPYPELLAASSHLLAVGRAAHGRSN